MWSTTSNDGRASASRSPSPTQRRVPRQHRSSSVPSSQLQSMPPGTWQSGADRMPSQTMLPNSWQSRSDEVPPQTAQGSWLGGSSRANSLPPRTRPPTPPPKPAPQRHEASESEKANVHQRYQVAEKANVDLERQLNRMTYGEYWRLNKKHFDPRRGVDIDWRVPRVQFCKDPKYNGFPAPPEHKMQEGQHLEDELGIEAWRGWAEKLRPCNLQPPPPETVLPPQVPFLEANPHYRPEQLRGLYPKIRSLDEALRGDVTKPMPRPLTESDLYEDGVYYKDDCPMA